MTTHIYTLGSPPEGFQLAEAVFRHAARGREIIPGEKTPTGHPGAQNGLGDRVPDPAGATKQQEKD